MDSKIKLHILVLWQAGYETEFSWPIKQRCNSLIKPVLSASKCKVKGRDCTEIFAENPNAESGVYLIKPEKVAKPFKVFCEKREDGGWTIFQRRHGKGENGQPVNFMRVWDSYKQGFGHVACPNNLHPRVLKELAEELADH
ncbi:fibrinogen gamma chain-like [Natator depressus]|uniref:fibrinogen gamma chain-like n=1 Tax=Natator depressus TaxID=27790 RepID=UPI003EBFAE62